MNMSLSKFVLRNDKNNVAVLIISNPVILYRIGPNFLLLYPEHMGKSKFGLPLGEFATIRHRYASYTLFEECLIVVGGGRSVFR